jgi:hypothetical protein
LLIAAMRLNHILAGILLLPLGVSTFWSGAALEQSWGLRLAGINALTLLYLPALLVTIMPLESLDAPLFRLGYPSRDCCLLGPDNGSHRSLR